MYLKAIEIYGFKSFGERKYIEFDKGITSIVGPNGSGKSNILDAVLWVLGEQAYKNIRARESSDVIFSGGKELRNLHFAEVSLSLDNSDRYFEYESNVIKITRKLILKKDTTESEYYINDKKARLKDIANMFLDTGIGKTAYSVIGQGKVERIINSQPKEIKSIIDEAAGIKKYQNSKFEAQKNLANFGIELDKINIMVKEKQEQRNKTEKQANEARKFVELRNERDRLAKGMYLAEQEKKNTQLEAEKTRNVTDAEKLNALQTEWNEIKARIEAIKTERDEIDKKMDEIDAQNKDLNQLIRDTEKERNTDEGAVNSCKNVIGIRNDNIGKLTGRIGEFEEKRAANLKEKENFEERLKILERDNLQMDAALEDLRGKLKAKQDVYDAKNKEKGNLQLRQNQQHQNVEDYTRRIREQKARLDELKKESAKWEKDIAAARIDKTGKEAKFAAKETLLAEKKIKESVLSEQSSEKSKRHSELGRKIEQDSREYNIAAQKLSSLEIAEEQNAGYSEGVKEVLASDIEGIEGTFVSLVNIPERYELAISMGAGGNMQDIIVDSGETAKKCVELLKARKAGRANFLAPDTIRSGGRKAPEAGIKGVIGLASDLVSTDKKYERFVEFVLGSMLIVDNMDTGLAILRKNAFSGSVVTLSGEVFSARGRISGGSSNKSGVNQLLSRKREIKVLREKVGALDKEIQKNRKEYEALGKDIEEIESAAEDLQKAVKDLGEEIETDRKSLLEAAGLVEQLERNGNTIEGDKRMAEDYLQNYDKMISEFQEAWEDLEDKIKTFETELGELDQELIELKAVIDTRTRESETKRIAYETLKTNIEHAQNTDESLEREIQQARTEIEGDRNDIRLNEQKILELTEAIKNLTEKINDLNRRYDAAATGVGDLRENRKKLEEEERKRNDDLRDTQDKIVDKERSVETAAKNIERLTGDLVGLEESLKELAGVEARTVDPENLPAVKEEVYRLNYKVKDYGDVNLLAIKEFEEVQEQLQELKKQTDDIVQSREKLLVEISGLDGDIRERFYRAFDAINENFAAICEDTLINADGKLEIVDPDNFDECGINISVKYRNKKRLPLSLLSGGEKSMVAICFVIAIFKFKPSPFAFLDEIESALDETNTMKLLKKLKGFTKETQFILITHNKTTMTQSDGILGVTMNKEVGVTEILGVNILGLDKFIKENRGTALTAKEIKALQKKK
ncbi:MAG: chromosome segregation protein SMC [Fusobacteriaceae bacterium]|jgi:chromosome segregation protein|nr:chromosome segregation protein SMC [Fusobacteriaceae bacterium]